MNSRHDPSSPSPAPGPTTAEDWELIRRSIAMLPPGAWAMRREQALDALSSLIEGLRAARHSGAG